MKINKNIDTFKFEGKPDFPNILLLHGLRGNTFEMRELGRYLNKHGFTVYSKRYKGHGSTITDFYKTNVNEWFNDALEAFLYIDKGTNNTFVCGLSMGGSFALKLASMYNVIGLITMNAPTFGFSEQLLNQSIDWEIGNEDDKSFLTKDFVEQMKLVKREYSNFIDELGKSTELVKITANTLIIQGLKDNERYIKSSEIINNSISSNNKKVVHFKESGHVITIEKEKKDVFETILQFVSNVEV